MNTNTATITAEIILTNVEGRVYAFVNGEEVTNVADKTGFIGKVDKALRAASIYRQSGYIFEAGAFIASGTRVVTA
jgi:hypothetical protein